MSTVPLQPELTRIQRLCIFYDSDVAIGEALEMNDTDITYDLMLDRGCKFQCIACAKLTVTELRARGFVTPVYFRDLGMDALDLTNVTVAQQMVRSFGAEPTRKCFVTTPSDVIALVGSRSYQVIGLTIDESLSICAGDPAAAREFLSQLENSVDALKDTSVARLLDCGLRARALADVGINITTLAEKLKPTTDQLRSLGFDIRL